ncbi:hypothetical protein BJV85_002064 [Clostridium acetobutylicum]|uniref:Uncharacterized protein n=1 Tax=Clostridium acetobutylicum (strain ATCC 824 / DSM 792 / JCM 1419 / IAM 19013 / LMG 5710 / NBRC 13948 / NRRL B-527 / VKM B-1787 / 2291 / W) TaxID=272562 RepID=Q97HS9_CLOAB|nr:MULTISPECIES: hypothetical protein [Clostridium]AAK79891.1 Hypothetical protein CA_C1929 [Clostridium acetobutylicum ATCC 824]ADZ20981.1 Conserved hypothetical protein [Clostridium acetobutylicum EA 2018]AEI32068.1 hypothetical protein SMB_G1958 [Clostridium acetobutylicum DSM 1731]AWV79677.1 hypothetical protein DK921_06100 [Clostridium acetobutylicum]MBC2394347.1 hypothetical protein [Clostridium acetobutylicum]
MVNESTGTMAFNELGISFVADDVSKKKSDNVYKTMDTIIEKHKKLAQQEFDEFLSSQGLESAMGVVIKKTT